MPSLPQMRTHVNHGIHKPNTKYASLVVTSTLLPSHPPDNIFESTIFLVPHTYKFAFKGPNWLHAMKDKFNALIKSNA